MFFLLVKPSEKSVCTHHHTRYKTLLFIITQVDIYNIVRVNIFFDILEITITRGRVFNDRGLFTRARFLLLRLFPFNYNAFRIKKKNVCLDQFLCNFRYTYTHVILHCYECSSYGEKKNIYNFVRTIRQVQLLYNE